MPKTPESGGIPLPHSWPPFTRSTWDARVASLLSSLGRMGHENEAYEEVKPVLFLTEELLKAKPVTESENGEETPTTRLLHTFGQRKAFLTKSMDLHRHTIGGGRSGRRGRAECVAFLRYALEILEEQRDEVIQSMPADEETGLVLGGELGEGDVLSDSDEEEESSEEEDEEEEEEEAEPEPEPPKPSPKSASKPKPTRATAATQKTTPSTSKKNVARIVIKNEKDFFDQHNDLCEVCNCPGELLCCSTCNLVFHTTCARPKLTKEPDDDWRCAYCLAEVEGGKKESRERRKAAQACREMEKTREELKKANEGQPSSADDGVKTEQKVDGDEKPAAEPTEEPQSAMKQEVIDDLNEEENQTTPKGSKAAAKKEAQSEESAKVKASSRSSTPCREAEMLTAVPKHLVVDEQEALYSNTGRIQRNRKKPTIYDPKTGPDSGWKGEGNVNSPAPAAAAVAEVNTKTPESPAAQPEKPPPKKRGPKPGKKKGKKKKKKPAKKAPPKKKKILPDTEGVGVLNRLPGALFDCSACLDIAAIKICCYCACRVCFNKFGKEHTILCDKCDQEYHTFCLNPPMKKLPDADTPWECPACIEDEKKKKASEARKIANAKKKEEEEQKRAEEEEKRAAAAEKRRVANEVKKAAAAEARKKAAEEKARLDALQPTKKPGRPRIHPLPTDDAAASIDQPPKKRGRGRPRKDGRDPIPRAQSLPPMPAPIDYDDTNVERSRSGRKIHRTIFHDETALGRRSMDGKRSKTDAPDLSQATSFSSSGFLERSAAAAAKNAIAGVTKSGPRRKPGARECMQMSRRFGSNVIDEKYYEILMDYSKRGKVDHLIRMRERLDDHSRFLEAQLAGLEAVVKDKGEMP